MSIAIHHNPAIPWQAKRVMDFSHGLSVMGLPHEVTESRQRISDTAILFGTTYFRDIEDDGDWLLVDRASIGDPDYVQLVWNGHGRRGDHRVPDTYDGNRWRDLGIDLQPMQRSYEDVVLCGQTDPYSPHWETIEDWYATVKATHFRPHPAGSNPTGLPIKKQWGPDKYHVLNSSVAVDAVIRGYHVEVHDEGCMAYDIRSREDWAHWLAWTQWHWDEIRDGRIGHLFEAL